MSQSRRVLWGLAILIAIISIGVIGYISIEGWPFLDALFMTIITITTVGYGEVHPLSPSGRIFSIFLIIGGVGGALYSLTGFIEYIVEGRIGTILGRRRMKGEIARLRDHFVICGYGRVGEVIANTFKEEGIPFVVIDNRPDCIVRLEQSGYPYLDGDATSDETLKKAMIEHARGLVAAVGSDADNTYITLSARGLGRDLFIAARASDEESERKLKRAGADRTISPYRVGALRMAQLALRPAVVDFIDTVTSRSGLDLQIENIAISSNSSLGGNSLTDIRSRTKATILAISRNNGELLANLSGKEIVEAHDRLITIGTNGQLKELEIICQGESNE